MNLKVSRRRRNTGRKSLKDRRNAEVALARSGEPEEIVTAALYLASPASGFTTGSVVRVDGGVP